MGKTLLTGFEAFARVSRNPAAEIALRLEGRIVGGRKVVSRVLPCAFGEARQLLLAEIARHQPEVVIALGVAVGRRSISLEKVAINHIDAPLPDNRQVQPRDCRIDPLAPDAHFAELPLARLLGSLRAAGFPAEISYTAGSFVCNELFFGLMQEIRRPGSAVKQGGFVHVPAMPGGQQQDCPVMPLDLQVEAICCLLASLDAQPASSIPESSGRVC